MSYFRGGERVSISSLIRPCKYSGPPGAEKLGLMRSRCKVLKTMIAAYGAG
jgi:hypothetical protein